MSDETNVEVKVEAATEAVVEVKPEVETIPETETKPEAELFDPFVDPDEPVAEPGFVSAEFNGHKVEFNEAGDCFISKNGRCLGIAAGVIKNVAEVKDLIEQIEKGE